MSGEPIKSKSSIGVRLTGTPRDGQNVAVANDETLKTIFGTEHSEMAEGLLSHCLKVLKSNEASDDESGNDERAFMLTAIVELKPRDAAERMLAVQMAATHIAMIRSGRWLASTESVDQVKTHYNGYTKLARTYAMQMSVRTLQRHLNDEG